MGRISTLVDDDFADTIDSLADHHDTTRSEMIRILLNRGLDNLETEIRLIRIEAKLDTLLESFSEDDTARDMIAERFTDNRIETLLNGKEIDLHSEPHPHMQTDGIQPEEWEGRQDDISDD